MILDNEQQREFLTYVFTQPLSVPLNMAPFLAEFKKTVAEAEVLAAPAEPKKA
jgi:hypothetical protein